MSSVQRKLGEKLYLNLQLYDGDLSMPKRVFVELRDETGVLTEPAFEIFHVGSGEFRESTRTMPANDMLSASYFVYEPDGTTRDLAYAVGKDTYMRDYSAEIIDMNLDVQVSTISGSSNNFAAITLTAIIEEDAVLTGVVPENEILEGSIEEQQILEGTIFQEEQYVC